MRCGGKCLGKREFGGIFKREIIQVNWEDFHICRGIREDFQISRGTGRIFRYLGE